MMFVAAVYHFLHHLRVIKNASEHTVRNYAIDLNAFKDYLENAFFSMKNAEELPEKIYYSEYYDRGPGARGYQCDKAEEYQISLEKIDKKTIRGFLASMTGKNNFSKKTIVRRLASLRSFFKYAFSQKMIESNPAETLETPKIEKKQINTTKT